jgi:tRNA A37 threonylcarbamoyladenosine synthetase subunit TsaC/SUA5/YrdC
MSGINKAIFKKQVGIGSLINRSDIQKSVGIIKNGGVVVVQMGGVIGMFADGTNRPALEKILTAKEISDKNRPFSAMMFYTEVVKYIDLKSIHADLQPLLINQDRMKNLIGSLIHLRLPLKTEIVNQIPQSMRSQTGEKWIMHNLDPTGRPIENFVRALNNNGVPFVAVTTLNRHGEPEITDWKEAIAFCQTFAHLPHAVSLHLADPTYKRKSIKGSLTIVDTINKTIAREGFVPTEIVEAILGVTFNRTDAKKVKHKQAHGFTQLNYHLQNQKVAPEKVRELIIQYISGKVRFDRKNGYFPIKN